jgi:hypothetical protein
MVGSGSPNLHNALSVIKDQSLHDALSVKQ